MTKKHPCASSTFSPESVDSHTPSNDSAQKELFEPLHSVSEIYIAKPSSESTGPTRQSLTTSEQCNSMASAMSLRAATPASETAGQIPEETVKACGDGHSNKSNDTSLFTLFERMFLETSTQEPLNRLRVTLKRRGTPSGHTLFTLAPSVPLTIDPGRGRWPTPTAQDAKNATMPPSQAHRNNGSIPCLLARMGFVGWVLNPLFYEELMMFPEGWTELEPSETQFARRSSRNLAKRF